MENYRKTNREVVKKPGTGNSFMEICELNMLEYYIAFAGFHTALSNRYALQAKSCGCIYGAKTDGAYAGFMCTSNEAEYTRITYALTMPKYRNQGIFTGLVRHVKDNYRNVRITISSNNECYDFMKNALIKLGFVSTEQVTVFSCSSEDEDKWHTFMERKGKRLCEMLEMHGYRAVSFQDLSKEFLEQVRVSDVSEYANMFHPAMYLDNPAYKLSWDLSFAAVRDGKLAAYCLVTMGDEKSAMFDQISVSADEQGRGVILLPYVYSMQRFFERGLCSAYYAMYGSNRHANAFRNRILKIFPTTENTMDNLYY